jgi:5-oxoprolinase (ATP-hydrolysing)
MIFRYNREFGFTMPDREVIVDDIRVRGVGKSAVDTESPILGAIEPAVKEGVSCQSIFIRFL